MVPHVTEPVAKKKRFRFIGETIAELKKVVWLSRREMVYLTVLVMVVAVSVGIIMGAIDYLFSFLVDKVIVGG